MANSRRRVLQLLEIWEHSNRHAQDLLGAEFERAKLPGKERALMQHLLFGILRQRRLLDHWIDHLRAGKGKGKGGLDDDARRLLQLGLFQLFHTRVPDHAAVNETLRLATPRTKGLINALLRRATRERSSLERMAAEAPAAIRFSLPDFLHDKWLAQFGEDAVEKLGCWCQEPAPNYLRRNDLRPEAAALLKDHGLRPAEAVGQREDFFQVDAIPQSILDAGAGYIQDPATVLACDLLGVKSGHLVLDACAAPGGKTAYLAQLMGNEGKLVATDSLESRLVRLRDNLDRLGATRVQVRSCDWKEANPDLGFFDRILLDVPCSNTGVLRRRVDLRWRLSSGVFAEMASLQVKLAGNILRQLRPGGRAVYSTCSIEPEENEQVVEHLLAEDPSLECRETVSSLPHRDGFDGAYAALLVKKTSTLGNRRSESSSQ